MIYKYLVNVDGIEFEINNSDDYQITNYNVLFEFENAKYALTK